MPNYHFHAEDGERLLDAEGLEFLSFAAAKTRAVILFSEYMAEHAAELCETGQLSLRMSDDSGVALLTLVVSVNGSDA
jgi:hypothetical protein